MIYTRTNKPSMAPTFLALALVVGGATLLTLAHAQTPTASPLHVAAAGDANLTATPNPASALPSTPAGVVGGSTNPQEEALLNSVRQINALSLDNSILTDPVFLSFTDFVRPTPQPAGRSNPFAPLSGLTATSPTAPSNSSSVRLPTPPGIPSLQSLRNGQ